MTRRPHPAAWIAAAIAVLIALGLAYYGFVLTTTGQTVDDRAMVAAQTYLGADQATHLALSFLQYLPELCAGLAVVVLVAVAIARRSLIAPAIAAASALGAAATTQLLKHVVLARPDLGISEATMPSFPSGHVTAATAAMIAIVLVTSPRFRPVVSTLGGLFAAAAGVATFMLGWHRPSDILGAYLVAGLWGLLGGWFVLRYEPEWNSWTYEHGAPSVAWRALPWIPALVGIATAVAVWAFILRGNETDDALAVWFLVGGSAAIIGSAMAVLGAASAFLTQQTHARS